jgi:hypothetical protein
MRQGKETHPFDTLEDPGKTLFKKISVIRFYFRLKVSEDTVQVENGRAEEI